MESVGESKETIEEAVKRQHTLISAYVWDFHQHLEGVMGTIPATCHKEIIVEMLHFYIKFLKKKKQKLTSFDFYKVISWYAILLASKLYALAKIKETKSDSWIRVIDVAVWRMLESVKKECKRKIPEIEKNKIITMVACEIKEQGDFGIGKNGLYMLMYILTVAQDCPTSHDQKRIQ
ncbi:MAG: hypothetical protein K2N54_06185 [Helicobacter sp.]|nr:hypothetical protein [Helicobacter sp.]